MRTSRLTLSVLALLLVSAALMFSVAATASVGPVKDDPAEIVDCYPSDEGFEDEPPYEDEEPIDEEPIDEEPGDEEPVEEESFGFFEDLPIDEESGDEGFVDW